MAGGPTIQHRPCHEGVRVAAQVVQAVQIQMTLLSYVLANHVTSSRDSVKECRKTVLRQKDILTLSDLICLRDLTSVSANKRQSFDAS